jgi:hypothetical protein
MPTLSKTILEESQTVNGYSTIPVEEAASTLLPSFPSPFRS